MGNLFADLKRRHIYRVAAAYAVVAWVLLQLFNNVAPILELPPWVARAVLLLLVMGFPVALLFAWMHQLAPTGGAVARPTTGKLDWALMGALVVVIALVSYEQLAPVTGARTAQSVAPAPGSISVAVLPFVNLSDDRQQEFFSDGMTEEITAALAQISGLRVTGRTSAFEFKGQNKDLRAIGQALGVSHLIEGSVRKAGNRVRITAQLVQAADDSHLWAENFDRDLTDVFAIQEEIAKAIAASLRVPLGLARGDTLVRARPKDDAAYEDYLRAKALVRSRTGAQDAQLTQAARLLETVIAREPDFAPAPALLAYAHMLMTINLNPAISSGAVELALPVVEAFRPKAEAAARRAIQLDPKNADGYLVLGRSEVTRGNFPLAGDLFARGLALDPANPEGLHFYSTMLADLGYLKQAVSIRERLQALEPLVPIYRGVAAQILLASGQPDAALAMDTEQTRTRADVYALKGRYGEAADVLLTAPAGQYLPGTVEAAARLLRSAPAPVTSPETLPRLGNLGFVYVYIGAQDRVLDWYEDMNKFGFLGRGNISLLWGPSYAGIRKTERFKAFVHKAGLVDYWRARGWPDLCRPVGADDFVCA